jgi:hypothetical protein
MHSSSLHTRMSRSSLSLAIGYSRPWLVWMSGTESTNSTPAALMAAMILAPSSLTVSAPAISAVSASMR